MRTVITLGLVLLVLAFFGMSLFSRWKLKTIGFVLAGIAAIYVLSVILFAHALQKSLERRSGPERVFAAVGATNFLEEAVAIECAHNTLLIDGLTNDVWQPAKNGLGGAPDGRRDVYLYRNSSHPLSGSLIFTNGGGAEAVFRINIEGTNIICQRVHGK